MWCKFKAAIGVLTFAVVHFAIFSVAYVQGNVEPTPNAAMWRVVATVLAVPLVTVANWVRAVDVFPIAMYANSMLWGVGFVTLIQRMGRAKNGR